MLKREAVILGLGFAALGGAVGWLTGWSGADDSVLAATLPAILSVVGAAVGALTLKNSSPDGKILELGGIALLAFSLLLGLGTHLGGLARTDSDRRSYLDAQATLDKKDKNRRTQHLKWQNYSLELYQKRLQNCALAELVVNETRQKLELPSLGPHDICPPHLIQIYQTGPAERMLVLPRPGPPR